MSGIGTPGTPGKSKEIINGITTQEGLSAIPSYPSMTNTQ